MADPLISDVAGLAKIADSKLAQRVYHDGLQKGTTEVGLLAGDLAKTTRMIIQPLFTVAQGCAKRLNDWVAEAVSQVPPERRVDAKPALLNAVVGAVSTEDDQSEMREFYVKLLASMLDREHQDEVYPAFPRLLQELSPIEALLLQITPGSSGVSLPAGLEEPNFSFIDYLVATRSLREHDKCHTGQYSFFGK